MNLVQRLQAARRASSDERGFTLIELLVSIVILGVLAAIVVFSTGGITNRGEASSLNSSARTIQTASEAYYAQCGEYAPTVAELVDPTPAICDKGPATSGSGDGYMQAPEGWTPALGNGPWVPFTGATMTYVPGASSAVPPTVTWTGPNGTTGSTGGGGSGGGGNTGPCTLVAGSVQPSTIFVTNSNNLAVDTPFGFSTTGVCGTMTMTLTRGATTKTVSGFATSGTGPVAYITDLPAGNGGWTGGAATGTVTVLNGGVALTPTATVNYSTSNPAPCLYTNGTLAMTGPVFTGGDYQIGISNTGTLLTPATVNFTLTGYCETVELGFDNVPGAGNRFFTVNSIPQPNGGTFSYALPTSGWGNGAVNLDENIEIRETSGGNTSNLVNSSNPGVDYIGSGGGGGGACTYVSFGGNPFAGGQVQAAINTSNGQLTAAATFSVVVTGTCSGLSMIVDLPNTQTTKPISGFIASADTPQVGQTTWSVTLPSGNTGWGSNTGTDRALDIQNNNTNITPQFAGVDIVTGSGGACTYVSGSLDDNIGNGGGTPIDIPRSGSSGNINNGGFELELRTTGTCTGPMTIDITVPNDNPTADGVKTVSLSNAGTNSGQTTWTAQVNSGSGWGNTSNQNGLSGVLKDGSNTVANLNGAFDFS